MGIPTVTALGGEEYPFRSREEVNKRFREMVIPLIIEDPVRYSSSRASAEFVKYYAGNSAVESLSHLEVIPVIEETGPDAKAA